MDIRNWPLDRIMQLPDSCFGRHWPIGLQATLVGAAAVFDISEAALPERCVVWELSLLAPTVAGVSFEIALRLGDQLPPNDAAFNLLEPVFGGVESYTGQRSAFALGWFPTFNLRKLRVPLVVSGQRLVGRFIRLVGEATSASVIIVVSSIPREVPDCLLSV